MNTYNEMIVKCNPGKGMVMLRNLLFVLLIGAVCLTIFANLMYTLVVVLVGFFLYQVLSHTNAEYEYIHTNGELDIDAVICNSRRKNILSIQLSQIILLAPLHSETTRSFDGIAGRDFAGDCHEKYVLIYLDKGEKKKLILRMNKKMLTGLKFWIPGKVELN